MSQKNEQIAQIMLQTGCNTQSATAALRIRGNILVFAIEYIERRDLPRTMSQEERFPMWFQYLEQKKRV